MESYQQTVDDILSEGNYRPNRTGVDTISLFGYHYRIDASGGYPLLTTKKMDTFRWDSMLHEFVWYLSGTHHVRDLKEKTGIWNAWADDEYNLPTAYGRFWRRFPVPQGVETLDGEWWPTNTQEWVTGASNHYGISERDITQSIERWVTTERTEYKESVAGSVRQLLGFEGRKSVRSFDQLQYIVDTLNGDNPMRPPESRRLVVSAWHPANADVSKLPPCHYTFIFNVQGDKLNLHLTQRSADTALGVPFNIAAYCLMLRYIANLTGYSVGTFSHFLGDAHIYCGKEDRGAWYRKNISELQKRVSEAEESNDYRNIREWVLTNTPNESGANVNPSEHDYGYDHVPGLLEQLAREPYSRSTLSVDANPLDEFAYDDVELTDYESHGGIGFGVAE